MALLVIASLAAATPQGTAVFGSFIDRTNAERHAANIARELTTSTQVIEIDIDGVGYHRVMSALTSTATARQLVARSNAAGFVARYLAYRGEKLVPVFMQPPADVQPIVRLRPKANDDSVGDRRVPDALDQPLGTAVFGSFASRANAERHAEHMSTELAIPTRVAQVEVSGDVYHRVVSLPMTVDAAGQMVDRTRDLGLVARFSIHHEVLLAPVGNDDLPPAEVAESKLVTPIPQIALADRPGEELFEKEFDLVTNGKDSAVGKFVLIEDDPALQEGVRRKIQKSRRRNQRRQQERAER